MLLSLISLLWIYQLFLLTLKYKDFAPPELPHFPATLYTKIPLLRSFGFLTQYQYLLGYSPLIHNPNTKGAPPL